MEAKKAQHHTGGGSGVESIDEVTDECVMNDE